MQLRKVGNGEPAKRHLCTGVFIGSRGFLHAVHLTRRDSLVLLATEATK